MCFPCPKRLSENDATPKGGRGATKIVIWGIIVLTWKERGAKYLKIRVTSCINDY